jgi:hypothetical protein
MCVIEMYRCSDAVGAAREYLASEVLVSALHGHVVAAADFTSLMTHINNIRTNALIGMSGAAFTQTPGNGGTVTGLGLQGLRDALK